MNLLERKTMKNTVVCAWGGVGKAHLSNLDKAFVDVENSNYMWAERHSRLIVSK